jgi:excisionase family DNA binding protein
MPDAAEYITIEEASRISGLSTGHLARLLRKGDLEGIKPARDWLVRRSAVMAYVRQERKPGPKGKRRLDN